MTAAEVFISLRSKSILHFFASIGSFLGLEVHNYPFSSPDIKRFNGWNYVVLHKMFLFVSDSQLEGLMVVRKCFDVIIPWHDLQKRWGLFANKCYVLETEKVVSTI